ncbi:MAG: hypothetical protein K9K62_04380 [Desulfobacteraceae bacterium]|nr:hypothetical protein [Desulfobacteraceae bacterium]
MAYAGQIALYHHERWDGQGYPGRMAGTDIPLPARVTAVADVFDVLLSWRPYKKPTTEKKAVEIIGQNRGVEFDPSVVDVFITNIDNVIKIRKMIKNHFSS